MYNIKVALLLIILAVNHIKSQVGVGVNTINLNTALTVSPSLNGLPKGTFFEGVTNQERDQITQPATGLVIFNKEENCLQVNNGDTTAPKWDCLSTELVIPEFSSMIFGKYKPIYPGLAGVTVWGSTSTSPTYSTTDTRLFGNRPGNGNFAKNDLFQLDAGWLNNLNTYTSILFNISGEQLQVKSNTVAYHTAVLSTNITLNNLQGFYIDGNAAAHYTEAQNLYLEVIGPAGSVHIGRKFLIGLNIFKEDISNAIVTAGTGTGKENQSMLTYIFEFK